MTTFELKSVETTQYPARLTPLGPEAFKGQPPPADPVALDESILGLVMASCYAGGSKGTNFNAQARQLLRNGTDLELRRSVWRQVVPCLRANEWLRLIADEGLTWKRAAEVLTAIEVDFGWLTGPVNDHAALHE